MELDAILDDVLVLDLTRWWSGPFLGRNLADLGATVIKVESRTQYDPWRGNPNPAPQLSTGYPDKQPGERPYDRYANYRTMNRGKHSLGIDLSHPRGRETFLRLAERADIVLENFSQRVMGNLGIDYPALRLVNPKLVMLSMPAFGAGGPESDFVAFGASIEWLSGITFLNRYEEGKPYNNTGLAFGDPVAGYFGMLALMAGMWARETTGEGVHVDLSQLEATTSVLFDTLIRTQFTDDHRWPTANRHPTMAPHGVYPCSGDDRWVAISVRTDEEWRQLASVMGRDLAHREELMMITGRLARRDELDEAVSAWTSSRTPVEVVEALTTADIPVALAADAADLYNDPLLEQRGYFVSVDGADDQYRYPGPAARIAGHRRAGGQPAPGLGKDGRTVLSRFGRLEEREIDELQELQVIGDGAMMPA